jgi:hypothetical protein
MRSGKGRASLALLHRLLSNKFQERDAPVNFLCHNIAGGSAAGMLPGYYSQEHACRALLETVGLDEADFACLDQRLRPIADPQLGQNMTDVTLDRIGRDDERVSDFLIRCSAGNQGENLPFTGT